MVVHGSPPPVCVSTHEAGVQAGPFDQVRGPSTSPQPQLSELGGLAPEILQYGHLNLPRLYGHIEGIEKAFNTSFIRFQMETFLHLVFAAPI